MKFSLEKTEKIARLMAPVVSEILQRESLMPVIKIKAEDIRNAVKVLRDHKEINMKYLNCISGTHLTRTREDGVLESLGVEVFYVFSNGTDFSGVAIRADLAENHLVIDTIDDLYGSANWFEREIYDLLGVNFKNSQDLRRIMLPDDWIGHPLRKDYKENASYNGMSTTRPDELASFRVE
jgi:NADH-quinone oxidoreductase subunit C